MIYQFRAGYSLPGVTAQIVGDTLKKLEAEHNVVTPAAVVLIARPRNAPLHGCFEWDDGKAAEKFRLDQARLVIRSVEVVHIMENGKEERQLGYVSIAENKPGSSAYMNTPDALKDERYSAKIIDDAKAQLLGWRRRYGHLTEMVKGFAAVVEAIDQMDDTKEMKDAKAKGSPRAAEKRPQQKRKPAVAAGATAR